VDAYSRSTDSRLGREASSVGLCAMGLGVRVPEYRRFVVLDVGTYVCVQTTTSVGTALNSNAPACNANIS